MNITLQNHARIFIDFFDEKKKSKKSDNLFRVERSSQNKFCITHFHYTLSDIKFQKVEKFYIKNTYFTYFIKIFFKYLN